VPKIFPLRQANSPPPGPLSTDNRRAGLSRWVRDAGRAMGGERSWFYERVASVSRTAL